MKILYFHQHFSTPRGAAGTRSYEMARALIKAGHQVTMVCGSYANGTTGLSQPFAIGRRRGSVDGIDVLEFDLNYGNHIRFLKRSWIFLKFALASAKVALTEPSDVIFATSTPLTAGIPGVLARWIKRKPFVFEVRDLWPEIPKQMGVIKNPLVIGALSLLEWVTYHSASKLIALSPGMAKGICGRGIGEGKVLIIPNGCDLALFGNTKASRKEAPKDHGGPLTAVFSGTHGMANNLHVVLDAAAVLKRRGIKNIKLLLVGQGQEKESLKARVENENLYNVSFLDPISKLELNELFATADLGLQVLKNVPAFYYGTSPNKFFDYLSAGLPVLTNYPGWVADLIETNHCGVVVSPNDPDHFADALVRLRNNPLELHNMGLNARRLAENSFDRRFLAAQFVGWIESCVPKYV